MTCCRPHERKVAYFFRYDTTSFVKETVGIVGAGSWGTALAALLAKKGLQTVIWAYEPEVVAGISERHINPLFLSQYPLPKTLAATGDLETLLRQATILVNAVPSHFTRDTWSPIGKKIPTTTLVVNASKGFEIKSNKRLSQVLQECLPQIAAGNILTISGPSFAEEVIAGQPTMMVVAGTDAKNTQKIQQLFRSSSFMTYVSDDIIGVEIGGAVKNVIAIGCGVCDGMGLGFNTRAALITRGLYEIAKLGKALGANPLTFVGLTGMGDLILTCTGDLSRNRSVGFRLGKGEKLADILKTMQQVAEGIKTAQSVYTLMRQYKIHAPLCTEIYRMLYENKLPAQSLQDLEKLELKAELGGLL